MASGPQAFPCERILLLSTLYNTLSNDMCKELSIEVIMCVIVIHRNDAQDFKIQIISSFLSSLYAIVVGMSATFTIDVTKKCVCSSVP